MTLIWDLEHFPEAARGGAVSVGNFDGVHKGHAQLIEQLADMARRLEGPAVAITFDPHPAAFLRSANIPERLTTIRRRGELLNACGADYVVVCRPSQEWLSQTAREFFKTILLGRAGARGIVEGPNFFFGRNREGDTAKLTEYCDQYGIELSIVRPASSEGAMISSTEVRRLLLAGDIAAANRLLTAPYRISGKVVHGDGRGKAIGFPTANLDEIQTLIPAPGVYASLAVIDGRHWPSATHIGPNPTFGPDQQQKVEIHVIDFDADLYGREIEVDLKARIRDIVRFPSVEDLVQQLKYDIAEAYRISERI